MGNNPSGLSIADQFKEVLYDDHKKLNVLYKELFLTYDADCDGEIEREEAKTKQQQVNMGNNPSGLSIADQFKEVLYDDHKKLNVLYKELFLTYDADCDGEIEREEAVLVVKDFMSEIDIEMDGETARGVAEVVFDVCGGEAKGKVNKEMFQMAMWKVDEIEEMCVKKIVKSHRRGLLGFARERFDVSPIRFMRGTDGFYHPSSEEEIIQLVQFAYDHDFQLRVRGASHSDSPLVYTDSVAEDYPFGWNMVKSVSTPTNEINVILDRYDQILSVDRETKIAVVQGGIHLGKDDENPGRPIPYEEGLLWQLHYNYGLTVEETGGISHQTIAGFISTGSSGGSLKHAIDNNIEALRIVGILNGKATAIDYTKDNEEFPFYGAVVSMGLLGVISTVTLKCTDSFRVFGRETNYVVDHKAEHGCEFDMFNQESLEGWFRSCDYARCMWWPQNNNDRIITWKATRNNDPIPLDWDTPLDTYESESLIASDPDDVHLKNGKRRLYYEFDPKEPQLPGLLELFLSIIGTIMYGGELKLEHIDPAVFKKGTEILHERREEAPDACALERLITAIEKSLEKGAESIIAYLSRKLSQWSGVLKPLVPWMMQTVRAIFFPLGEVQRFNDYSWHGLPMDNTAPDDKLPMWFSEIWVPMSEGARLLRVLNEYFNGATTADSLYKTGLFSWEIYCTPANSNWMHMAYSNGNDIWKDGCMRVDMIWFGKNQSSPRSLFKQHWNLMKASGIPFRLHWGKDFPDPDKEWIAFWKDKWEKWDDFLALRTKVDPKNTFLTKVWGTRLGIYDFEEKKPHPIIEEQYSSIV
eukprot:TRINITY_DN2168_c0_g1_i1.p1 TRINITY_DN2168_c0_g1~~TRINITY_DN2168_c0_g1_i1.p1  ORF type:complete len:825 (-),score=222.21 TRINITY_DN2168_c0_g1_i1:572-3001(-)